MGRLEWVSFKDKWLICAVIGICLINFFYFQHLFSFRFVDEEDNLVLGHFLLQGERLYSDLFSHHQPFGYILSAVIQLVTRPSDIYSLVQIHRLFMLGWSFIWAVVLLYRFRSKLVVPLLIYELSKYYLLGNLFLAESLSVYPVLYSTFFLFEKNKPYQKLEFGLIGLLVGFTFLLLAPMWPFLIGFVLLLIWFKKIEKKHYLYFLVGCILPVLIALPFMDFSYYFHNVFYINYKYYIPQSAEEKMPFALIKAVFSPILGLVNNSSTGIIIKLVFPSFIFLLGLLIKQKKYKLLTAVILLLTLANIRYYTPGLEYKAGFHLLIWYSLFISLSLCFLVDFLNHLKSDSHKTIGYALIGGVFIGSVFLSQPLFQTAHWQTDYQKNYSQPELFGNAIKAMRQDKDTLFVVPDEWLLYFQSGVLNNNKMVNFYSWMSLVWEINDPVAAKFQNDPPTFFYCDCQEDIVTSYSEKYKQLVRNGAKTPLWILHDRLNELTDQQKTSLRSLNFQLE